MTNRIVVTSMQHLTIAALKIKATCLDRQENFKLTLTDSDLKTRLKLKNTTLREVLLQPVERRWCTPKRSKSAETTSLLWEKAKCSFTSQPQGPSATDSLHLLRLWLINNLLLYRRSRRTNWEEADLIYLPLCHWTNNLNPLFKDRIPSILNPRSLTFPGLFLLPDQQ